MLPLPTDTLLQASHLLNAPLAYLDPGTGSLIVQAVVGAVIGVAVALKVYWHKIKAFFFKRKAAPAVEPNAGQTPAAASDAKDGD